MTHTVAFTVSDDVRRLGLKGVYFVLSDMEIPADGSAIDSLVADIVGDVRRSWSDDALLQDPVLKGFSELHERVGRGSRKNIASPVGLLQTVLSTGSLPRINVAVDLYNIVSLRTRLALGAHDVAAIDGSVALRLTSGTERFVPLGRDTPRGIGPGEYAYIDESNEIICRMETRQVEKTKVVQTTTSCFYIVQGNDATDISYIDAAVDDLVRLTTEYCGGSFSPCGRVE